MTADKQALLPCPFCGSTNLYERRINGGHGESDAHIACLNCGAMGPSDYGRDHNAAWNNRPELAAVTAERDKLCSILSDLKEWDYTSIAGFSPLPLYLRRRMQEAIDAARDKEATR